MNQKPIQYQFYHQRFDKLAEQHAMLHGEGSLPDRKCDNRKKGDCAG